MLTLNLVAMRDVNKMILPYYVTDSLPWRWCQSTAVGQNSGR